MPSHQTTFSDPAFLQTDANAPNSGGILSSELVLCRICERQIPAWFFEKHNEVCIETHRMESAVSESNERLAELETLVVDLISRLKQGQIAEAEPALEYQGVLLDRDADTQNVANLEVVLEHLKEARQISTPAAPEEPTSEDEPIENKQLLSPRSESAVSSVVNWQKPSDLVDVALSQLVTDIDSACQQKVSHVDRMRNTIIYADRIRQEWETRVENYLAEADQNENCGAEDASVRQDDGGAEGDGDAVGSVGLGFGLDPSSTGPQVESSAVFGATDGSGPGALVMDDEPSSIPIDLMSRLSIVENPISRKPSPSLMASTTAGAGGPTALSPSASPVLMASHLGYGRVGDSTQSANGKRRGSGDRRASVAGGPVSPRIPSSVPAPKAKISSIKDFEVIKPISKGAFGSVYLAKKKATGDYYAIKVLKKSDMVAKNQVTNVKAERMILMTQADSDFVVKLFWTFQSRDYLYLVMEYLNGGDCAALIKALGSLEEDWVQNYIAEVVLGLDHLHAKGVVHRWVVLLFLMNAIVHSSHHFSVFTVI